MVEGERNDRFHLRHPIAVSCLVAIGLLLLAIIGIPLLADFLIGG